MEKKLLISHYSHEHKSTIEKLKKKLRQVCDDPQQLKTRLKGFAGLGGAGSPEAYHQDGKTEYIVYISI
ncbi:uncharacterized protein VTP21DRAFT_11124 [Calcarisporiella thermophila]|uniref:uncharacterized protein n=1 Tax=Calcarisporiella thermophila TaxID=911321 RepID=UPI0037430593